MEEPTIEDLILTGAVEVAALDQETGELLYNFTPKMKELLPELYREHVNDINNKIMNFWEKGFVVLENMLDSAPIVKLTEKSFDSEAISMLSEEEKATLKEIKRILKVV